MSRCRRWLPGCELRSSVARPLRCPGYSGRAGAADRRAELREQSMSTPEAAVSLRRLDADAADFPARFAELLAWESVSDPAVQSAVADILQQVRSRGNATLLEFTQRFDRSPTATVAELELPR